MTREELLEIITESTRSSACPNICTPDTGFFCRKCSEKILEEYENQVRNAVIDDIKDMLHEIYHLQFYCHADMCEQEYPTVEMCMDCFYDTIDKRLERLKGEGNAK